PAPKWPPVCPTEYNKNARNSSASCGNCFSLRARNPAGESMLSSNGVGGRLVGISLYIQFIIYKWCGAPLADGYCRRLAGALLVRSMDDIAGQLAQVKRTLAKAGQRIFRLAM